MVIPRRCSVCDQFLSAEYQERSPHAKTCGAPSCRKERTRLVSTVYAYQPPEPGDHDHADPTFKPRERECGRQCGRRFWTTSRWRYYCKSCRDLPSIRAGGAPYAGSLKVPDETSA